MKTKLIAYFVHLELIILFFLGKNLRNNLAELVKLKNYVGLKLLFILKL
jgi:hypothetical protein